MTEQPAHEQKRQLIETIHADALHMQGIDERESMTLMTVDEVTEYYDQLVPHTKDTQVILAAVEAEIYIRRSERIAQEPLQPGRRTDLEPVTSRVTGSDAKRKERSRMRIVGKNAAAAREYVDAEVKANRKATRKGIIRHAQRTAPKKSRLKVIALPRTREEAVRAGIETREAHLRAQTFLSIEKLADGQRRTDREIHALIGTDAEHFLQRVKFIPWLMIKRTPSVGTVFTINKPLQAICDGAVPRPELGDFTWRDFYQHLRAEITRRRKEANDLYRAANWRHGTIHTQHQSELLDWIEEELNRIP